MKLLYISDWSTNDIYVYDYNKGTLEGQLTSLNDPYGQCVDKKGNVWVVAYGPEAPFRVPPMAAHKLLRR